MNIKDLACALHKGYRNTVDCAQYWLTPLMLLLFRLWTAKAFFTAGQVKIVNWDSTLYLFESEYQVPLLPFEAAACLATATELLLPPLLVLGLLTRPTALVLFLFNAMAVISYPLLWEQGFLDHQLWGVMLLVLCLYGPGKLSIDHSINHWLQQRLC